MGAKQEQSQPSIDALVIRGNSLNAAASILLKEQLVDLRSSSSFDEELAEALKRKETLETRGMLEAQRARVVASLLEQLPVFKRLASEGFMSGNAPMRLTHAINDLQGGGVVEGFPSDRAQLAFPHNVLFPDREEVPLPEVEMVHWLEKALAQEAQEEAQVVVRKTPMQVAAGFFSFMRGLKRA